MGGMSGRQKADQHMNILVVLDHPRRDSLTGACFDAFTTGLRSAGHRVELADLHREGFDPRMKPADEPDWSDAGKRYSDAVLAEQARILRNDTVALVFPVWWWSVPAMLKGWIDRVWNNGWAYGDHDLAGKRGIVLALAAGTAESYGKRDYDRALAIQLQTGIFEYCGIPDAPIHMLWDSTGSAPGHQATLLEDARRIGAEYR
jgi:NAD(P)H dehydrogenase (quinone)